jgi:ankyrin repeat protein
MRHIQPCFFLLYLFYFASCSVADNQSCSQEKLLQQAASGSLKEIETCYKNDADILVSDKDGKAIYTIALENGHPDLARRLQEIQTMVWEKDNSPMVAQRLYEAIEYDNVQIVGKFIERGFDISAKHINGVSPTVFAVFNESNNVLELLLNNGVDVDYEFDFRPLICIAAMFDQQETVKILLAHGANVNDKDGSGVTPLMFAARDGYIEMVKFLLAHGADKTAVDIEHNTALDMAKANSHEEVANLLSELD